MDGVGDLSSQLGPLPKYDENANLQSESFKALQKLLFGIDAFVFRDERIEDYGVDFSLELKLSGRVTNFRAQVQMKGSQDVTATQAGYIPLQVATANLNYLLSGPSPLYFLWDAQKDEFWYVWAQAENRRLMQENPLWRQQDSITLQFSDRLRKDTVPSIVERILQEGRLHREIRDRLARATEGEQVFIRIDADSLSITDSNMATSLLLASGTAIVAAGYPQQVLELLRLVEPLKLDLARMQLTAGYAEYMTGKHWQALGHIRRALARSKELSTRDDTFLQTLKDACEFHAGIIDSTEYQQRATERAGALTGLEALEAREEALYYRCVSATDLGKRSQEAKNLRAVTEQILNHPDAVSAVKLNSRLLLLYVEGVEANLAATRTSFAAEIRGQLFPSDLQGVVKTQMEARSWHLRWEEQATEALRQAYELNHPLLIFQALLICLRIRIGRLFEERQDAIMRESTQDIRPAARTSIEQMLQDATRLNQRNGSLEGKLQLEELRADFLELQGKRDEAKKIAASTYPTAEAMGFGAIAAHSKRLLDDNTLLQQWEKTYRELREADPDVQHASQTDEEMTRIANQFLLSMGPTARLEVVMEMLRSFRRISQERINWCLHLVIWEDLSVTGNPELAFQELPTRKCHCEKFGHTSETPATDAATVILQFKEAFCSSCSSREPKRTAGKPEL